MQGDVDGGPLASVCGGRAALAADHKNREQAMTWQSLEQKGLADNVDSHDHLIQNTSSEEVMNFRLY